MSKQAVSEVFQEVMTRKGWHGFGGRIRVWKLYLWDAYFLCLLGQIVPIPLVAMVHRWRGAHIGRDTFIDRTVLLDGLYPEQITIEDDVRIGPRAVIVCHTTAGMRLRECGVPFSVKPIHIGKHAMICTGAIILPGVTIGEGGLVAAGAVVSQDVPPYTVVAGNPARPVKRIG